MKRRDLLAGLLALPATKALSGKSAPVAPVLPDANSFTLTVHAIDAKTFREWVKRDSYALHEALRTGYEKGIIQ